MAFPPSSAASALSALSSAVPATLRRKSKLEVAFALLPLAFVLGLFSFSLWAFFVDLVCLYLLANQGAWIRGPVYAVVYLGLLVAAVGSIIQARIIGGGRVKDLAINQSPGARAGRSSEADESRQLFGGEEHEEDTEQDYDAAQEQRGKMQPRRAETSQQARTSIEGRLSFGSALRDLESGTLEAEAEAVQVKRNGGRRFCRKCNLFKPDRAHHCSICQRCVLRMDHHCPWLGGACVGWANYKAFILFLLYTGGLGCFVAAATVHTLFSVDSIPSSFELSSIGWIMCACLGGIVGFCVGLFGIYHLYLAGSNKTTIEAMERLPTYAGTVLRQEGRVLHSPVTRYERKKLEKQARRINVYDRGSWRKNLEQSFGPLGWKWVVPFGKPEGDGSYYPVDPKKLRELQKIVKRLAEIEEGKEPRGEDDDTSADESE